MGFSMAKPLAILEEMVYRPAGWLGGSGEYPDIVVSSRVRLARNLAHIPFAHRASQDQLKQVVEQVASAQKNSDCLKTAVFLKVEEMSELDKRFLVERHLISPLFAEKNGIGGIFIGDREIISIMVNEEDHLRLQAIQPGFQPKIAWWIIDRIDDELGRNLEYAFSDQFGYLTACPTNTGTGMRASVLIHLPGLVLTQEVQRVLRGITQVGLAVRGFHGEGTEVLGNLFQISNQTSLGQSEEDIITSLERVTRQIIEYEQYARETLMRDAKDQIEDKIWRAYGILRSARILSTHEFMNLSSAVRLGLSMKVIDKVDIKALNELLIIIQPSHLQKLAGKRMTPDERDIFRAELVRSRLG